MKKILIYVLALLMLINAASVLAEAPEETAEEPAVTAQPIIYDYDHLTAGTVTPFEGSFFTQMWGNASPDVDVRMLIHGYNLVRWNSERGGFEFDSSVVSGELVTENADGDRTYTVTLYSDLAYNDGVKITARDYAFSYLLTIAPEIREIGGKTRNRSYLMGYEDYVSGNTKYLAGIRIVNDYMLTITVRHEYLPFFYELGLLDCPPYPIHVIAPGCEVRDDGEGIYIANPADEEAAGFTAETLKKTILDEEEGYLHNPKVSAGAYKLISFDGNKVELEKNPEYKGDVNGIKPQISKLTYMFTTKEDAIGLLESGDVGLLNKLSDNQNAQAGLELVRENENFTFTGYPRRGLGYFMFCCERPTVGSQAVRQAIAMCLDKDILVPQLFGNTALRADGYYGIGQRMYRLATGEMLYPTATGAEPGTEEYEREAEKWAGFSIDNIPVYPLDPAEAARLLEEDGWTLNRNGEAYSAEKDDVRCKEIDGQLVTLELTMLCPAENHFADRIREVMTEPLRQAGILLTIEEKGQNEILPMYYRVQERDCDIIFMATNFDIIFDPSVTFMPDGEYVNYYNVSAIKSDELYKLAQDMLHTVPKDMLDYCMKWQTFQIKFQELLPMLTLYSNMYYDFYPTVLQNYNIGFNTTWGQAIIEAFMGDPPVEETPEFEGE